MAMAMAMASNAQFTAAGGISLLDLPTEVLLLIIRSVRRYRDINSLARTNRFLYGLSNEHLYQLCALRGGFALNWGIKAGRMDTVAMYLKYDRVRRKPRFYKRPAFLAAINQQPQMLKMILHAVSLLPNPEAFNLDKKVGRWTALTYCAKYGRTEMVRLLVESGADLSIGNNKYRRTSDTALYHATLTSHEYPEETAVELVRLGAPWCQVEGWGRTLFEQMAWRTNPPRTAVIREILKNPYGSMHQICPFPQVDNFLVPAAETEKEMSIVERHVQGIYYRTFFFAVTESNTEVVKAFLEADREQEMGALLLDTAVRNEMNEYVTLALDDGQDVNGVDSGGWTPVMLAIFQGWMETVQLLVERGADLMFKGPDGESVLSLARRKAEDGDGRFVEFLEERGVDVRV